MTLNKKKVSSALPVLEPETFQPESIQFKDLTCPSLLTMPSVNPLMSSYLSPYFSLDGKFMLVPELERLDVFNMDNNVKVTSWLLEAEKSCFDSGNIFNDSKLVYTVSGDGILSIWSLETKKLHTAYKLNCKVFQVLTSPASPTTFYCLVQFQQQVEIWILDTEKYSTPHLVSFQDGIKDHPQFNFLLEQNLALMGVIPAPAGMMLAVHPTLPNLGGLALDVTQVEGEVSFQFVDFLNYGLISIASMEKCFKEQFTLLRFHPNLSEMAFSTREGPIYVSKFPTPKIGKAVKMSTNKLHWHANGALALCYTPDGLNLLSGGDEAVLLNWDLKTLLHSAMPRLRDSIVHLTSSSTQSLYAIRYEDGSVATVIPTTLRLRHTWPGLVANAEGFQPILEPSRDRLVAPSHHGNISFYNLKREMVEGEMPTMQLNRVTDDVNPPKVHAVGFSPSGEWMATATSIKSTRFRDEIYLHLFKFDSSDSKYVLDTEVRDAHLMPVKSLAFSLTNTLATISMDGTLKIWDLPSKEELAKGKKGWVCKFQTQRPTSVAQGLCFSHDGSLLCVTYSDKVALWNPITFSLHQYLGYTPSGQLYSSQFIPDTPYLVTISESSVVVFNLLAGSVWWTVDMAPHPDVLTIDPEFRTFTVIGPKKLALTFDPSSPTPIRATTLTGQPMALLLLKPRKTKSKRLVSNFLLINKQFEFTNMGGHLDTDLDEESDQEQDSNQQLKEKTHHVFSAPQPLNVHQPLKSKNSKKDIMLSTNLSLGEPFNQMLQVPSHVAPPVNQIINEFIQATMAPLAHSNLLQNQQQDSYIEPELLANPEEDDDLYQAHQPKTTDFKQEPIIDLQFLTELVGNPFNA